MPPINNGLARLKATVPQRKLKKQRLVTKGLTDFSGAKGLTDFSGAKSLTDFSGAVWPIN